MNLASRVRVLEEEKIGLLERLEEEEERAKELSRQIQTHTQQVRQYPEFLGILTPVIKTKGKEIECRPTEFLYILRSDV